MSEEKTQPSQGESKPLENKVEPIMATTAKRTRTKDSAATDLPQPVNVPTKFKAVVEAIEQMSVLDLAELVKLLEDKFGVFAAVPAIVMAGAQTAVGGGGTDVAVEAKTEFTVELIEAGNNKIAVIKAVKAATGLGLADAKALVDGTPKVVKEKVKKEEAEAMKKAIEEAGGKVELK